MKKKILLFAFVFSFISTFSQVGIGTSAPNLSSQLDVVETGKGILIPRVSLTDINDTTTIINGNINSLLVFNTTSNSFITPGFYYWYVNRWFPMKGVLSGSGSPTGLGVAGDIYLDFSSNNLYTFNSLTNSWELLSFISGDSSEDIWVNNPLNQRVELSGSSNGVTPRSIDSQVVIKDNGNMGLGIDNPDVPFEILKNITDVDNCFRITSNANVINKNSFLGIASNNVVSLNGTVSQSATGLLSDLYANGTNSQSGNIYNGMFRTWNYLDSNFLVSVFGQSSAERNLRGGIFGGQFSSQVQNSATIGSSGVAAMTGSSTINGTVNISANNSGGVNALRGTVSLGSTGNAPLVVSNKNIIVSSSGFTGNTIKGIDAEFNINSNISNLYGLHIPNQNGSGIPVNSYGVRIDNLIGTNKWGIYQSQQSASNYFSGKLGLGTTTPNSNIHVNGSVSCKIISAPNGYQILNDDYTILAQGDVVLPNADNTNIGRIYNIVYDTAAPSLTIYGTLRMWGTNRTNLVLNLGDTSRHSLILQSNGSAWVIISGNQ